MELCEKQKAAIFLVITLVGSMVAFLCGFLNIRNLITTIIGESFVAFLIYWLLKQSQDVKNVLEAHEIMKKREERIQKQEMRLEKLRDNVFTPWSRIECKRITEFEIKIPFYVEKDPFILEEAKNYLNDEYNEGKEILELIKQIENLQAKFNNIGDDVRKNIEKHFSQSYQSLEGRESQRVSSEDCYIINNIIHFVEAKKEILINNTGINWNEIRLKKEPQENTWRLIGYPGTLIQSKNPDDASELRFKCVIEKLIQEISDNLKQLNILHKKIDNCLNKFREVVNRLSRRIEYHRV